MTVLAVVSDLILASRIEEAARRAGVAVQRVDEPPEAPPPETALAIVDWSGRGDHWPERLSAWRRASDVRIVLFGAHTDLAAHAAAKRAGLGPMWARSKLVADLDRLVSVRG